MYLKNMTKDDIKSHIHDIYGVEISANAINQITNNILKLLEPAKKWQNRPLKNIYAVVFMDVIRYFLKEDENLAEKSVYIATGIDLNGIRDVLGIWVCDNERANFLNVIQKIKARGVDDILITCVDNLKEFTNEIKVVYPKTETQHIVHHVYTGTKPVSPEDNRALMYDLQSVYDAPGEQLALSALDEFYRKWKEKHPRIDISRRDVQASFSNYFKYPKEIRDLLYNISSIKEFSRRFRKIKNKDNFPTDDSLFNILYLVMTNITQKWTDGYKGWEQIYPQLESIFPDRL